MKLKGGLTTPTRCLFLGLKTQSDRPKPARELFQQSHYPLHPNCREDSLSALRHKQNTPRKLQRSNQVD